jgi:predicted O-methyltransferase YrrM
MSRPSIFRFDDARSPTRRGLSLVRQGTGFLRLPPRVARFYLRALRTARRAGDQLSLDIVTRPRDLAALLRLARGRRRVAELGTASAWTSIALALDDPRRRVLSYDVVRRPERERYLALVPPDVRDRIELHDRPGGLGPDPAPSVELVFIDSSHEEEETVASFEAWRRSLAPGGVICFHDYGDPSYPGVVAAVRRLGLKGEETGHMFVWRS